MPCAPIRRLQLRGHREVAHDLRHRPVDEVIALQLAEDRAPVASQHAHLRRSVECARFQRIFRFRPSLA